MSTEKTTAPAPVSPVEVHGRAGQALKHALDAQREFMVRLAQSLVASGALPAAQAKALLVETADGIESGMPKPPAGRAPTLYFGMIVERLRDHAKALRGIGNRLG